MTETISFFCKKCQKEKFNYISCLYGDDELKCPECHTIYIVTLVEKSDTLELPSDGGIKQRPGNKGKAVWLG